MAELKALSTSKSFGGTWEVYSHPSTSTNTPMRFALFRPPQTEKRKVPVLYWLSGLTCTEENFMAKAGAARKAAELGLMIVAPDTSPRGEGVATSENGNWALGLGASYYVNATQAPWSKHYQMYDYITKELPKFVLDHFPAMPDCESIFGHSMGGHGALVAALRQPGRYRSVSAFAPVSAPSVSEWGRNAFTAYLGADQSKWSDYDTCQLISKATTKQEIFVDQGTQDQFLLTGMKIDLLKEACEKASYPLNLRMQEGYDHSYYFIATFIDDHINYHAKALNRF